MNNFREKFIYLVLALTILIFSGLIYYYPLQWVLAEKNYMIYAKKQGVSNIDIKSKYSRKDYKQDGYCIIVEYYSDPMHRYEYSYYLMSYRKKNIMYCRIYNLADNRCLDDYSNVVYKPLE